VRDFAYLTGSLQPLHFVAIVFQFQALRFHFIPTLRF
jgi:hypothetical protein